MIERSVRRGTHTFNHLCKITRYICVFVWHLGAASLAGSVCLVHLLSTLHVLEHKVLITLAALPCLSVGCGNSGVHAAEGSIPRNMQKVVRSVVMHCPHVLQWHVLAIVRISSRSFSPKAFQFTPPLSPCLFRNTFSDIGHVCSAQHHDRLQSWGGGVRWGVQGSLVRTWRFSYVAVSKTPSRSCFFGNALLCARLLFCGRFGEACGLLHPNDAPSFDFQKGSSWLWYIQHANKNCGAKA